MLPPAVNDVKETQRLIEMGIDGIITDRVDSFLPDKYEHAPPEEPIRTCTRCSSLFRPAKSAVHRLIMLHREEDAPELQVCESCIHQGDVVPITFI